MFEKVLKVPLFIPESTVASAELSDSDTKRLTDAIRDLTSENKFYFNAPSVTRIMQDTMTAKQRRILEAWRAKMVKEMGVDGFNFHMEELKQTGTQFHQMLQSYLRKEAFDNELMKASSELTGLWDSVVPVVEKVRDVFATELSVQHELLGYRGIIDAIVSIGEDDRPTLIEWKTSTRVKKTWAELYDHPTQCAAYAGAQNCASVSALQVHRAVVVMCYKDGTPADVFTLESDMLRKYWNDWLARVHLFWTKLIVEKETLAKNVEP